MQSLSYEEWKLLEQQCKEFKEETHNQRDGYYYKSIMLSVGDACFTFKGPSVKCEHRHTYSRETFCCSCLVPVRPPLKAQEEYCDHRHVFTAETGSLYCAGCQIRLA